MKNKGEDFISSGAIDIQHLVKPGNLVKVIVKKVLENGLIVKFLNFFYGYIFIDHLNKEIY
jgi:hypothetical protein